MKFFNWFKWNWDTREAFNAKLYGELARRAGIFYGLAIFGYSLYAYTLPEVAQGPFDPMYHFQGPIIPPGTATVQPENGVVIRRLTDLPALQVQYAGKIGIVTSSNVLGITNGYSRFENVSPDGKYLLGFGTTPYAILFDPKTLLPVRYVYSPYYYSINPGGGGKIGDYGELKWNPGDGKLYYAVGHLELRQDPDTGAEEKVYDYGKSYYHTSDGSFDNSGRLLAMALIDGYTTKGVTLVTQVAVIDVQAKSLVRSINYGRQPAGVDIDPLGRYVKIDNFFYNISDGAFRNQTEPGHGGWCRGLDGSEWFVNQNSRTDWIQAWNPETSAVLQMMRMGSWAGMHAASDKRGYFPGLSLISTYKSNQTDPLGNELFFLQLASQKPGMVHPYYFHGTTAQINAYLKLWNAANAPLQLWDICPTQSIYHDSQYFTEQWASVGVDHCLYWGGSWGGGAGCLELYRAEIPQSLLTQMGAVSLIATPTPTPTPTPVVTATPVPSPTPIVTGAVWTDTHVAAVGAPLTIHWFDPAGGTGKITLYFFNPKDGGSRKATLAYVKNTGEATINIPALPPGNYWPVEKSDATGIKNVGDSVSVH